MGRLNTLDLPTDIWLEILSHLSTQVPFIDGSPDWWRAFDSKSHDMKTLQTIRLVCRHLKLLVDPLLCPVLRLSLSTQSMMRIDALSRAPLIAQGVYGIELDLSFWPAVDIAQYASISQERLAQPISRCYDKTGDLWYEEEDESSDALQFRVYRAAGQTLDEIHHAWRQYSERHNIEGPENTKSDTPSSSNDPYPSLLQEGFDQCKQQHLDQERIVMDGSFVCNLASAIGRFTKPLFLSLLCCQEVISELHEDPLQLANDLDRVSFCIRQPLNWADVEKLKGQKPLTPARILTELPIACDLIGAPLRGLDVSTFPLFTDFPLLLPPAARSGVWADLARSCRNLETFRFTYEGEHCLPLRPSPIDPKNRHFINNYLGAICSSPQLRYFTLSMFGFQTNVWERSSAPNILYSCGSIIDQLRSLQLESIRLFDVEMSSSELERCVSKLSCMRKVQISGVYLTDGGYARTAELLRNKAGLMNSRKKPIIDMSTVQGGEFGPRQKFDEGPLGAMFTDAGYWRRLDDFREPLLLKQTLQYIETGEDVTNPLRTINT